MLLHFRRLAFKEILNSFKVGKNMKILFLAGADSIHSVKWISAASEYAKVSWFSLASPSAELPANIQCYQLRKNKGFNIILNIIKLRRFVKKLNPDILHVHYLGHYAFLTLFLPLNGIKLIGTAWGSDINEGKLSMLRRLVLCRFIKKARLLTTDARYMVQELDSLWPCQDKIKIVNFGIDTAKFQRKRGETFYYKKWNLGKDKVILSTRNFESVYDVSTVINAYHMVAKVRSDTRLILLGRGSLFDDLKKQVKKLKLESSVIFTGFVPNNDLPEIYSLATVYVSSALSDAGIAASTAEAMACETVPVITDVAENSSWVEHEKNGFLFKASDTQGLADLLINILSSERDFDEIRKKSRETIIEKNDYTNEMKKMMNEYKLLMRT